jgi:membrane-anchored mycosin MYCP
MSGRVLWAAVLVCGFALAAVPFRPAVAAPGDQNCAAAGQMYPAIPWQQKVLAPERVWPFSRGSRVRVAVLGTGVDAAVSQLSGHVAAGFDASAGTGTADSDCLGLGTAVAGTIAAQPSTATGLVGLAPGAIVMPVRILGRSLGAGAMVDPAVLANGITWAVDQKADVIDVTLATYTDSDAVRAAVEAALARNVVVVAAVGDLGSQAGTIPTPYPASYPGVVGVGAVDANGMRWSNSQFGPYVSLVAPGVQVVTLQRAGGMVLSDGTGVASGYVAATAALLRARLGAGTPVTTLVRHLLATATPAPGGETSPEYGHGLVNPYAALTGQLANGSPRPLPALAVPVDSQQRAWAHSRTVAEIAAGVGVLLVVIVLGLTAALPRARRRYWRSGLAPAPTQAPEPEPGPPIALFTEVPGG